jgi:predicted small integral membrane protein
MTSVVFFCKGVLLYLASTLWDLSRGGGTERNGLLQLYNYDIP